MSQQPLQESTRIRVRFSEVDAMRVVWHGNYLKYFEDGREAFGRKYGIGYFEVEAQKLLVPVVKTSTEYKRSLNYGDEIEVTVRFENSPAAKIILHYTIRRVGDDALIATGTTVQVFTDLNGELQLITPDFFAAWKKKWL